jgi:hypothetical protein
VSLPPPGAAPAPSPVRELVVALEAPRRRRRHGDGAAGAIRFGATGVVVEHGESLRVPLRLAYGALALAAVDPGPAEVRPQDGRFAVLRRLGPDAVVPEEEGVEGWLWTGRDGAGLPALGGDDVAPNGLLLLARPIPVEDVARCFAPAWVQALAARSPLGEPRVGGLLLRLADPAGARAVFERTGLARPLTDREVPPALRRRLAGDRPADPVLRAAAADAARAATSVAPPGLA